jgi:hypothetical protein
MRFLNKILQNEKQVQPRIEVPSLEEEKRIFQEKFSQFEMRLKLEEVGKTGWARISFYCNNIQEYIRESQEARRIISEGQAPNARPLQIKANYDVAFNLDKLTISDIKGSYYDYVKSGSNRVYNLMGSTGYDYSYDVPVRRLDFILSDNTGKVLSYAEIDSFYHDEKTWSAIRFSKEGDEVRVGLSYVFQKEDEKDISFSKLLKIRNYSLEARLNK